MDSNAALAQLQQQQSQAKDPNAILSGQRQQLGVQGAQDTVTGLRGAINNTTKLLKQVAPSIMGRTASSLVNNAQATGQIINAERPISQRLTEQGTQYGEANENLNKLEGNAREAAGGIYQGQRDKLSYAQNLYNTLYQKERDAQATADAERDRQEATRQFNASLKSKSAGDGGFNLTPSNQAPAADPQAQKAATALTGLFKTNDAGLVSRTIRAITDSANRGNAYDKIKLQLLDQYRTNSAYGNLINKATKAR